VGKFIPVEPEKWAEMVKAQAEVERLNVQVETLRNLGIKLESMIDPLVSENARLKAEVERLTFDPMSYLDDQGEWMPRHIHLAAVERIKAEVERLTKAGDAMAKTIGENGVHDNGSFLDVAESIDAWNAAKKGGQP
jgi:hypothetical protein